MVAINKQFELSQDDQEFEDMQAWSDEFDSTQHIRDLFFWSGLSLAIGIFIGIAICSL